MSCSQPQPIATVHNPSSAVIKVHTVAQRVYKFARGDLHGVHQVRAGVRVCTRARVCR